MKTHYKSFPAKAYLIIQWRCVKFAFAFFLVERLPQSFLAIWRRKSAHHEPQTCNLDGDDCIKPSGIHFPRQSVLFLVQDLTPGVHHKEIVPKYHQDFSVWRPNDVKKTWEIICLAAAPLEFPTNTTFKGDC
jgi:hypothetical protein